MTFVAPDLAASEFPELLPNPAAQTPGEFLADVAGAAIHEAESRLHEVYGLVRDPDTYEVHVDSDITLEDYKSITKPEDWALIEALAEPLEGKTVVFVNPTMTGGGVAMMRPPLVHLLRQLDVDAHWYVMEKAEDADMEDPFKVTKKIHNVSQRKTDEQLTDTDIDLHYRWADGQNGPVLETAEAIASADVIVIDDPQPAPLIGRFKAANPDAKFIWRNHIDTSRELMSDPSTPQSQVADYLLYQCGVVGVDAVITHPVPEFVHPVLDEKTYFAPATLDRFDNLNRKLTEEEIQSGIRFINAEIAEKNQELVADGRLADVQPLLDESPEAPRVTLIARFDPSKGMDKAMQMGVMVRKQLRAAGVSEKDLPEVVIVGNGSVDDPDGGWMFDKMLQERREKYPEEAHGITVMRLRHNYDAMNALMRRSQILMQTSDAEGLETRVSDAIMHGKPVVVSSRGGMKTQVVEGKSGIVLDYDKPGHDLEKGARFMAGLLTDPEAYAAMVASTKEQAKGFNSREFTTPANAARILRIVNNLLEGAPADRVWKMSELAA